MKKTVSWKSFTHILKEHVWSGPRWIIFLGGISMIIGALSTAALTQWIKPVIDEIFVEHRADRLIRVSFGVFLIFFIRGFAEYTTFRCTDFIGQRLMRCLQTRLFQRIVSMNIDFFRQNHEGTVISLLTHDVNVIKTAVIETMMSLLHRSLTVIFLISTMVKSSFTMFWIALWLLPVVGYLLVYCQKKARILNNKVAFETADLSVFFQQIFQNIVFVKSSNTESKELHAMNQRMNSLWNKAIAFSKVHSSIHPVMDSVAGLSIAVGVFFVGQEVIAGQQTVGAFFSFIMALVFIYPPIKLLISLNTKLQDGLVSAQRIENLLNTPMESDQCVDTRYDFTNHKNEISNGQGLSKDSIESAQKNEIGIKNSEKQNLPSQSIPLKKESVSLQSVESIIHQDLVFENIRFQYSQANTPVLDDFSCRFLGGKKMALVGSSGAGKTTLFYLLLQLYKPESGRIFIGDTDISTFSAHDWRKNIAFVGQEIALFSDTIAENIAYGLSATRDEIQQAAAMAYADEFIESLPKGYDTLIGTRGLMLSGGQRQRLALARAFLRNSPILLLDEATSALDGTSEKKIKEATFHLMEKRTTLMIAHRFSTIEAADCIMVLDHGRVVQEGTHQELMHEKGLYQKWATMQQL